MTSLILTTFINLFDTQKPRSDTGNYKIWIFRSVPNSIMSVSENSFNSYDSNRVICISYLLWGTRNGSCRFLCLHVLSQLPLDVYGRIICRWKGILKGNPTPLESWETVQWGQSYSKDKFDE